ncbi:MAG: hypothetical protein MUC36_23715 [Planctomycetes bacterium]|jgi:hypothetical protein|nr:hypothetical protein [Planctomycetota bacterium]
MKLAVYLHPFDLEALPRHGGLARLRDLGVREVALATSYHDGRWLMPWHPDGPVRFLEDGTVHFRPRADYGVLRPLASSSVSANGPSPLERLLDDAPRHGLRVRAWTVFTHNSRLGALHPELCVENAFGNRHGYALCPSQPAVQQYVAAMVGDLAAHPGLGTIELEALGQMGWKHSSHHDKASFAPSGLLDAALSACFCTACAPALAAAGHDPDQLRQQVRTLLQAAFETGDAMAPAKFAAGPDELGPDGAPRWLGAGLAQRAAAVQQLAQRVIAATPHTARAVQVHPQPWFTGSQLTVAAAAAFPIGDERVLTCYGEGPEAIGKLLATPGMRSATASPRRVCVWPKAPQFRSDEDLQALRVLLQQHGIDALSIYHLGLLPWRTLERVAKMVLA